MINNHNRLLLWDLFRLWCRGRKKLKSIWLSQPQCGQMLVCNHDMTYQAGMSISLKGFLVPVVAPPHMRCAIFPPSAFFRFKRRWKIKIRCCFSGYMVKGERAKWSPHGLWCSGTETEGNILPCYTKVNLILVKIQHTHHSIIECKRTWEEGKLPGFCGWPAESPKAKLPLKQADSRKPRSCYPENAHSSSSSVLASYFPWPASLSAAQHDILHTKQYQSRSVASSPHEESVAGCVCVWE